MEATELCKWLYDNGYYDEIDADFIVLVENHDNTYHGLPSLIKKQVLFTENPDEQTLNLVTRKYRKLKNPMKLPPRLFDEVQFVTIDGKDFELNDIGHSDRRFYVIRIDE